MAQYRGRPVRGMLHIWRGVALMRATATRHRATCETPIPAAIRRCSMQAVVVEAVAAVAAGSLYGLCRLNTTPPEQPGGVTPYSIT